MGEKGRSQAAGFARGSIVGKTTLVKLFAKEFDTYIYMNLRRRNMLSCLLQTILSKMYWLEFISKLMNRWISESAP